MVSRQPVPLEARNKPNRRSHAVRHWWQVTSGTRRNQDRRIATRYEKKAANFLGFVWLATTNIMLL